MKKRIPRPGKKPAQTQQSEQPKASEKNTDDVKEVDSLNKSLEAMTEQLGQAQAQAYEYQTAVQAAEELLTKSQADLLEATHMNVKLKNAVNRYAENDQARMKAEQEKADALADAQDDADSDSDMPKDTEADTPANDDQPTQDAAGDQVQPAGESETPSEPGQAAQ